MSITRTHPVSRAPDAATGLNGILHALTELDNQFQQQERQAAHHWPTSQSCGDLSLCALFLRDNVGDSTDDAGDTNRRLTTARRVELTSQTKKRFVALMLRVARAHEGISRQERAFIRQFWRALLQR